MDQVLNRGRVLRGRESGAGIGEFCDTRAVKSFKFLAAFN
jgi:hypothetical protein